MTDTSVVHNTIQSNNCDNLLSYPPMTTDHMMSIVLG